MACFIAPAAEAAVMTAVEKHVAKKETEIQKVYESETKPAKEGFVTWSRRLRWLNGMLWGGSALLMLEHIWHGEIVAAFPFLTAVSNGETVDMLKEIAVTGGAMALTITAIWGGVCFAVDKLISKQNETVMRLLQK